ncbi:hypothetical protein LFYK43_11220 [Ligilactobacillus salitolerans]|uniref:Uncharacterized protein n=1 Tax=Ligilactobacillus salitolerans TaxID=1808352 RepID=A0A401ISY8_9LACO|nr:hypothetical protein [Ligilactobacillus salitolerans]GBG94663.1 hypothetical protein LFYK43_11220 [Ligilactobacillus salitolerans]
MWRKLNKSNGFALAEALATLWIVSGFILIFCSIRTRALQQEHVLFVRTELASQLLSKSNELLMHERKDPQAAKMIEVNDGTEEIRVELQK